MVNRNKRSAIRRGRLASPKTSVAIDSSQLLSLCMKMRESMSSLEKSIQLTKLKLTTLAYIRLVEEEDKTENKSLSCFEHLIDLCNLSRIVVQLLDQLHSKLSESSENSIQYQIASQQLMYFTNEWYDNFTPKLNDTFELAYKQDLIYQDSLAVRSKKVGVQRKLKVTDANGFQADGVIQRRADSDDAGGGSRLPERAMDALLRLRESMRENERLIAAIATNVEYTRATIDTIHDSLQSTKLNLDAGETNAVEAVKTVRESRFYKLICYLILAGILAIICILILKLIGIF